MYSAVHQILGLRLVGRHFHYFKLLVYLFDSIRKLLLRELTQVVPQPDQVDDFVALVTVGYSLEL